jgi:hypothetical protein
MIALSMVVRHEVGNRVLKRGMPLALRGGFDAVFSEDVGDGASANLMSQIAQRAADSRRPATWSASGAV